MSVTIHTHDEYRTFPFRVGVKANIRHCHCQCNEDGSYTEGSYGCNAIAYGTSTNFFRFTNTQHDYVVRLCNHHGRVVTEGYNLNGQCRHPTCQDQCSDHATAYRRRMLTVSQMGYCMVHFKTTQIITPFEENMVQAPTDKVGLYQHNKVANWPANITTEILRALIVEDSRNTTGVTNPFPRRLIDIIGPDFIGCTYTTYSTSHDGFNARLDLTEKVNGMCKSSSYGDLKAFVRFYNSDIFRDAIKVIESLGEEKLTQDSLYTIIGWRGIKDGLEVNQTTTIPAPPGMTYYTNGLEWKFKVDVYIQSGNACNQSVLTLQLPPGEIIPEELRLENGEIRVEENNSGQVVYKWDKKRIVRTASRMEKVLTKMYGSKLLSRGAGDAIPSTEVDSRDILPQLTFSRLCLVEGRFVDKFRVELDNYKKGNHTEQNQIVDNVYTAIQNDEQLGRILIEEEDDLTDGLTFVVLPDDNFPLLAHSIFGHLGGSRVYASTTNEEHNRHLEVVDLTAKMLAVEHKTTTVDQNKIDETKEKVRNASGAVDMVEGFSKLLLNTYPGVSAAVLTASTKSRKRKDNSEDNSDDDSEGDSEDDSEDDSNY